MNDVTIHSDDIPIYAAPRVLASFDSGEILAEAETGSVVIVVS